MVTRDLNNRSITELLHQITRTERGHVQLFHIVFHLTRGSERIVHKTRGNAR